MEEKVEILFQGPLTNANDTVKCNYIIYWSRGTGMELVDKWKTEEKITDDNRNQIARYFELFEGHICPKSNALIAIVELKRLFQESMSLEDFHTKALRLVKEAEYPEGATWNRVLQDTMISGLASDKIRAKIIKEGKDVTLARVMEIAHLEVSTQKHLDRMQETAKVNYVQYGKGSKSKKCKPRTNGNSGGSNVNAGKPKSKGKKPPLPTDICWRCGKTRHKKGQICKALESICRNCRIKGHYEKVCMKKSAYLVDVPCNSSDASPLYFNELGEPVYAQTHAVQVNGTNKNKHLIQLPVSVNLEKVRKPAEGPCPTVLLKADMGADVNLLNSTTFDQIIGDRSVLQPSTLRMETYRGSRVEILGKFNAFLRWKGKIFRQPFYVTTANLSPNLLSRDACYTLEVVRPCYSVEGQPNLQMTDLQANLQGLHMADLQENLQGSNMMDLQENLQHNLPQIHSIEACNTEIQVPNHGGNTETQLPDEELRQRPSRYFTAQNTQTAQSTEIVRKEASAYLNTGYRSTHKSAGCVRSATESTRSTGSTR